MDTIMSAKNVWSEGLIMDFAPDNTSANCLTSALNATLITYNGNEMSLQNDMGNARVETAFLPEGYIPVGTCEFGDIIYIASYNPLTNKSQIGCFPSPERNISSEEIGGLQQSLDSNDFQVIDGGVVTGELKSTSVKKILMDSKKLNPGDKYIIYSSTAKENFKYFGNYEDSKKYLTLSVVSIDDSGKMTKLDTETYYYDTDNYKHFICPTGGNEVVEKPDIDSYRSMLQSGYNIFSSKNSGKLALLAELNTIQTFSCTYSVIAEKYQKGKQEGISYTIYFIPTFDENLGDKKVYISRENELLGGKQSTNFSVTTIQFGEVKDLTKELHSANISINNDTIEIPILKYTKELKNQENNYPKDSDESRLINIVNKLSNYASFDQAGDKFAGPINDDIITESMNNGQTCLAFSVNIPYINGKPIKSESLIYSCNIVPCMPFGKLDFLSIPISIDLNKIGTGDVGLTQWKYYNQGGQCTLQYGLEIYNKPNYETKRIIIDFYDNSGLTACYLLDNQDQYSGVHTEYLGLEEENYNTRLSNMKDGHYIAHKREYYRDTDGNEEVYVEDKVKPISEVSNRGLYILKTVDGRDATGEYVLEIDDSGNKKIYINDAGVLYSNILYAAKITVVSGNGSNEESVSYWRWLWTNSMYNEYYYQVNDFDVLKFKLDLNANLLFEANSNYKWESVELNNLGNSIENGENREYYKSYSANVQYIGQNGELNLNMYIQAGLQNDYGCFNLLKNNLDVLDYEIYLGEANIEHSDSDLEYSIEKEIVPDEPGKYLSIESVKITDCTDEGKNSLNYINRTDPINVKDIELKDTFNINGFNGSIYQDSTGNSKTKYYKLTGNLQNCFYTETDKKAVQLNLAAAIFTKSLSLSKHPYSGETPTYIPIINSIEDLYVLGIEPIMRGSNIALVFKTSYIGEPGKTFTGTDLQADNGIFSNLHEDDQDNSIASDASLRSYVSEDPFVTNKFNRFSNKLERFFIWYPGGQGTHNCYTHSLFDVNSEIPVNQNYRFFEYPKYEYNTNIRTRSSILTGVAKDCDSGLVLEVWYNRSHKIYNVGEQNVFGILCTKTQDGGFVAFNSGYYDWNENYSRKLNGACYKGGHILQDSKENKRFRHISQYPNLAWPLFLILSRTYCKEKTSKDANTIDVMNYVKRDNYATSLQKEILIKLKQNNKTANIVMRGIDYNSYKEALLEQLENEKAENINKEAINLTFNDCLNSTQLTLDIQNKGIEFPEMENTAFLTFNGSTIPCKKIEDDGFYIYYNDELSYYEDQPFKFKLDEILTLVNRVTGMKGLHLSGHFNEQLQVICPNELTIDYTEETDGYPIPPRSHYWVTDPDKRTEEERLQACIVDGIYSMGKILQDNPTNFYQLKGESKQSEHATKIMEALFDLCATSSYTGESFDESKEYNNQYKTSIYKINKFVQWLHVWKDILKKQPGLTKDGKLSSYKVTQWLLGYELVEYTHGYKYYAIQYDYYGRIMSIWQGMTDRIFYQLCYGGEDNWTNYEATNNGITYKFFNNNDICWLPICKYNGFVIHPLLRLNELFMYDGTTIQLNKYNGKYYTICTGTADSQYKTGLECIATQLSVDRQKSISEDMAIHENYVG